MKPSDEKWTIVLFRGTSGNPLGISLRKVTIRRLLLAVAMLSIVQVGFLAHYVVQRNQMMDQVVELEGVKAELSQFKNQEADFSEAIDTLRQRVLTIQSLNEKLQVMFGLAPEQLEDDAKGQGGEEVPYESVLDGVPDVRAFESLEEVAGENFGNAGAETSADISSGLAWLDRLTARQLHVLALLEEIAGERVGFWASTPSVWPVKGLVSSKFGPRISPFTGKRSFHAGLDISAPRGEKIRAPANGKVVLTAYGPRMGNFIRVDHRYGVVTTYGHLSKILVRKGQKVKRGDVLGLVGSTGRFSTGPHLHYQVAVNNKVVDPLQYILD